MEQAYLHPEIAIAQSAKRPNACGDVVHVLRKRKGTLVLLCDGIGSGIKANLAARMLISRFIELLEGGFSFRACFTRLVATLNRYRHEGKGYVAFTAMWILPDGGVSILTHDAPEPLRIIGKAMARPAKMDYESIGAAIIGEGNIVLRSGEGILAVSDGITQSMLGTACHCEWPADEMADFVRHLKTDDTETIAQSIHREALNFWGNIAGDDCTAVALKLRPVNRVTIFTGPPAKKAMDVATVNQLMKHEGVKIVCGGSTANIVARVLNREVNIDDADDNPMIPPSFDIAGIDLTTEGIVTLNQVCNLLEPVADEPAEKQDNAVERLYNYLVQADRIDFLVGQARNPGAAFRTLQQLGVKQRNNIVAVIAEKLRELGKLVTVKHI